MSVKLTDISVPLCDGIFTVLNNFIFKEVDEITLTGTGGTATVVNNALSKTATFATSLTQTATNFVAANAAAYLVAGSVLTSSGAKLIFTTKTGGVAFTGATSITNATTNLAGTVAAADIIYPVYLSIPKTPADIYVYAGGVIHIEDGDKDNFAYPGTVQVRVVVNKLTRAERKLVSEILGVVRQLLKPTKATVFTVTGFTLVVFSLESMNEMIEQNEGNTKISLIDTYNFLIQ